MEITEKIDFGIAQGERSCPQPRPLRLFHCGYEQCEPLHGFGPAIRPHYLLHFVKSGKGRFEANGKRIVVEKNQGFLIFPGETTYYCADPKEPWEYFWIGFDGIDVLSVLNFCGFTKKNPLCYYTKEEKIWVLLQNLIDEYQLGQCNELKTTGLLYQIFSEISQKVWENSRKTNQANYVEQGIEYIHHNYSYPITINEIAKFLHMERSYLFRMCKNQLGMSLQQYLIFYRLQKSEELLENTSLSITEIAYSCGFKDASSFDKHYKKHYGLTPRQYRQKREFTL